MAAMATWLRGSALALLGACLALAGACSSQQEVALSALHYFQKGNAAYQAEDYPRAVEHYRMALQFDDEAPDIYYNLGLAYYRVGAYEDAVAAYQQAVKLDPAFSDAHLNLALAYNKLYNAPAANLHYNRYRTLASGNAQKDLAPPPPPATAGSSASVGGFQRVAAPPGAESASRGASAGAGAQAATLGATAGGVPVSASGAAISRPQPATFSPPQIGGGGARRTTSLVVPQPARPGTAAPAESLPATQQAQPNPFQGNAKWWTQDAASQNR
jgi:tetratricopeptide (TPR) repeat protein